MLIANPNAQPNAIPTEPIKFIGPNGWAKYMTKKRGTPTIAPIPKLFFCFVVTIRVYQHQTASTSFVFEEV